MVKVKDARIAGSNKIHLEGRISDGGQTQIWWPATRLELTLQAEQGDKLINPKGLMIDVEGIEGSEDPNLYFETPESSVVVEPGDTITKHYWLERTKVGTEDDIDHHRWGFLGMGSANIIVYTIGSFARNPTKIGEFTVPVSRPKIFHEDTEVKNVSVINATGSQIGYEATISVYTNKPVDATLETQIIDGSGNVSSTFETEANGIPGTVGRGVNETEVEITKQGLSLGGSGRACVKAVDTQPS